MAVAKSRGRTCLVAISCTGGWATVDTPGRCRQLLSDGFDDHVHASGFSGESSSTIKMQEPLMLFRRETLSWDRGHECDYLRGRMASAQKCLPLFRRALSGIS